MLFKVNYSKLKTNTAFSLALLFFGCVNNSINSQTKIDDKKIEIRPFTASILNGFSAEAYSIQTILTEKNLKIIFKSDLEGARDTIVFEQDLQNSDTLKQISEINIASLEDYYENPCIADGSQITVLIKKDNIKKSVHVSNYYQDDIGKIIYLINSLVPSKYKIWYDKDKLLSDNNRCKGIKD